MLEILNAVLLFLLLVVTVSIIFSKHLIASGILMCVFSSLVTLLYLIMNAPDVALTEASVGAGLSTVFMFAALSLIREHKVNLSCNPVILYFVLLLIVFLSYFIIELPNFGSYSAPIHWHVAPFYIENTKRAVGISNVVTAILASFRSYDTFGETIVIFTAALCVTLILKKEKEKKRMIKDPVLNVLSFLMIPFIIIFALYIQFHGDYIPGGGFQAGIIITTGIVLYSMLFGIFSTLKVIPYFMIKFVNMLGILIYGGVGIITVLFGKNFLSYDVLLSNGIVGQKFGIFLVELGTMLTVFSSMLIIYISFTCSRNND